ncbi:MAG: hypothetical protein KDE22_03515, partial [Rhodobacterales bacterium]|nr:hypothetical protein [Rhodobacterales bacterium]
MSPLLAVPAVAALGIAVLVLVARDLGRRAGLGVPGRIALVGGLGFGVIAVTIKAGIILYL